MGRILGKERSGGMAGKEGVRIGKGEGKGEEREGMETKGKEWKDGPQVWTNHFSFASAAYDYSIS